MNSSRPSAGNLVLGLLSEIGIEGDVCKLMQLLQSTVHE